MMRMMLRHAAFLTQDRLKNPTAGNRSNRRRRHKNITTTTVNSFLVFGLFLFSPCRRLLSQDALQEARDSTALGDLWFERGMLREARYEHLRALKIRTARLPPGHADVAESLESMGNVAIREVRGVDIACVLLLLVVFDLLLSYHLSSLSSLAV